MKRVLRQLSWVLAGIVFLLLAIALVMLVLGVDRTYSVRTSWRHFNDYPGQDDQGSMWETAMVFRQRRLTLICAHVERQEPLPADGAKQQGLRFGRGHITFWNPDVPAALSVAGVQLWLYDKSRAYGDVIEPGGGGKRIATMRSRVFRISCAWFYIFVAQASWAAVLVWRLLRHKRHGFPIIAGTKKGARDIIL